MWISIFGALSKFFSHNCGELNNEEYMELCEAMNIIIKKTAAEAPFSNGLCERHNAVWKRCFRRQEQKQNVILSQHYSGQ